MAKIIYLAALLVLAVGCNCVQISDRYLYINAPLNRVPGLENDGYIGNVLRELKLEPDWKPAEVAQYIEASQKSCTDKTNSKLLLSLFRLSYHICNPEIVPTFLAAVNYVKEGRAMSNPKVFWNYLMFYGKDHFGSCVYNSEIGIRKHMKQHSETFERIHLFFSVLLGLPLDHHPALADSIYEQLKSFDFTLDNFNLAITDQTTKSPETFQDGVMNDIESACKGLRELVGNYYDTINIASALNNDKDYFKYEKEEMPMRQFNEINRLCLDFYRSQVAVQRNIERQVAALYQAKH